MLLTARRIFRHRSLLLTLTSRELKARYRGTVLGFLWSLVNPLLLLGVYSFVFNVVFRPHIEVADPYVLFLVCGLFPWIWVSGSLLEGTTSVTANAGLIRKALFPVELLPMVSMLSNLAHFLLALPILGIGLVAGRLLGFAVAGWSALLLPVVVIVQLLLISGMALALAALNTLFKDVRDVVANLLTLFFYLTPILYPLESIPYRSLKLVVAANPFSPFTLAYRQILFEGVVPGPGLWVQMAVTAVLGFGLGTWLFERLSETLVEAV